MDNRHRMRADRSPIISAVAVLGVLLVLVIGTVQAVHAHPDNAKGSQHSCSICSAPNANLNTQKVSPVPVMVVVPVANVEATISRIFRPSRTNFVRPPPAA
jgi:hypothetical protein